jgi:hypothetical protein
VNISSGLAYSGESGNLILPAVLKGLPNNMAPTTPMSEVGALVGALDEEAIGGSDGLNEGMRAEVMNPSTGPDTASADTAQIPAADAAPQDE